MTAPRYLEVADIVRSQIADGTLKAGLPAPSGAALARVTGYSGITCRKALRTLTAAGVLVRGPSRNARLRVAPGPAQIGHDATAAADALSDALAARRHAADLTQLGLAELVGRSVTTVGHAETGRLWQSRRFWENADRVLRAGGELLRLHDAYRTATAAPGSPQALADASPPDGRPSSADGTTRARQEGRMTLQAEQGRVHIDRASAVTVRMPTADERAVGYPDGAPVLVVANVGRDNVFPHWITLAFDDPHGQPEPDAVRESAVYVLGVIGEELGLVAARVADLAEAVYRSPCSVVHLADRIREERAAEFGCMDASVCEHAARTAAGPSESALAENR
jgi:DNA-binding transcriptional regulator YhcF (GntR family)